MKRKCTYVNPASNTTLSLLAWAILCSAAAAHEWETRRAMAGDQRSEWSQAGYLPAWNVTLHQQGDGFQIDGDHQGHFRGTVLVGCPLELPSPVPAGLRVRLRFQTFCELNDPPRAGQPSLVFYTPDAWRWFSESNQPTIVFDPRAEDQRPLLSMEIGAWGEDVTAPRDWQSDELAKGLRDHAGQTVIMAIDWSAHHFNAQEWAEFDRIEVVPQTEDELQREFFQSLDLSSVALSPVNEAVAESDWSRAGADLAGYYRNRKTPPPPPLPTTSSKAAADRIVDHVFSFVGCTPHQLGPEIAWNEDPFDYDQWAISLNRHFQWRTLGSAYAGTGDERYAREFAAQLRSWIDAMPVEIGRSYVEGPYSAPGRLSLSLDAGIRMADTWFPAFYYFLPSENFTDDDVVAMLRSFRRQALYFTSTRLPYAGWSIMRSGWERDACYLLLDGGPFGTGHQHEDKLSIIVQAFGKALIPEAGTYAYDASDWRKYVLSTRAHNTIMVDGHGQRHRATRRNFSTDRPLDTTWTTGQRLDLAEAVYDLGYGDKENVPVEHHRAILFVKPRLWLVVDRLISGDDRPHTYESLFHLDATDVQLDAATSRVVTANPDGANVALIPLRYDGWSARIVEGQTEPVVQGWLPTKKHNVLRPVPTAVYSRQTSGDTRIAYLIAPLREGESAPTVRPLGGGADDAFALEVKLPDGAEYVIVWNEQHPTSFEAGAFRTNARAAVFSTDGGLIGEIE